MKFTTCWIPTSLINISKVFPGIEIDVLETGHLLVVAERETIKGISHQLKEHTEENNFIKVNVE
ncbi:hypothetical protein [Halobacillus sp. A5]|uniref:hypothetical protein n=1 Tax=Halobacillus sp. A5 TaxID=2880263 RepID=UPI0020A66DC0|nr:hypothetical protein [Halobacillus sp. A5]MCP3027639.1 hypothetical protein [Halobacillus sp. A5]